MDEPSKIDKLAKLMGCPNVSVEIVAVGTWTTVTVSEVGWLWDGVEIGVGKLALELVSGANREKSGTSRANGSAKNGDSGAEPIRVMPGTITNWLVTSAPFSAGSAGRPNQSSLVMPEEKASPSPTAAWAGKAANKLVTIPKQQTDPNIRGNLVLPGK
jgi:hypothetical protein